MKISLVPIVESIKDADLALSWALDLWADHIPNYSPSDWADFYAHAKEGNYERWTGAGQELVYLAKSGEDLIGAVGIVDFDELDEYRHLTPWIAAFVVNPELRGQGFGTQILELLEDKAKSLGIKVLHLWTEDQKNFYSKRGYSLISRTKLGSLDLDVMQKKLVF